MFHQISWSPGVTLADMERQVITHAMRFYRNDKVTVATSLKVTPKYIEKKLEQYENDKAVAQKLQDEMEKRQADYVIRARGVACKQPNGVP